MQPDIPYDTDRLCIIFRTIISFPKPTKSLFELVYFYQGKPYCRTTTKYPDSWKNVEPIELSENRFNQYQLRFMLMAL